ncbi:2Fe-2S iron-sulfur cluster-binding protein [Micrococcus yunnanensis]|uniref:2Fe-2S iron-sulfur cluster-binding protein n=1 Tax=Micrococcus yunnanensis TaxID=566027 RepID=UPI0035C0763D
MVFRQRGLPPLRVAFEEGVSLLELAKRAGVTGVLGRCGGYASCGTCHVYWADGPAEIWGEGRSGVEDDVLESAASVKSDKSRLACQVMLTPGLGTVIVDIAPRQ